MKESYLNLLSRDPKSNDHLSSLGQSRLLAVSLHPLQPEICGVTNMIMPLAHTQGEKVPIALGLKIKLLHLPCQAYNLQNPAWQAPSYLSSRTWPRPHCLSPATLTFFCLFLVSRTEASAMLLPLLGTIFFLFLTWLTPTHFSCFNHIQEIHLLLSFLHSLRYTRSTVVNQAKVTALKLVTV